MVGPAGTRAGPKGWLVPALLVSAVLHGLAYASINTLQEKTWLKERRKAIELAVITRPRPPPPPVQPPPVQPEPPPPVQKPKVTPPKPSPRVEEPPKVEEPPRVEPPPPAPQPAPPAVELPLPGPAAPTKVDVSEPTVVVMPRRPDGAPGGQPGGKGAPNAGTLLLGKDAAARLALKEHVPVDERSAPPSLEKKEWKHKMFFAQVKDFIRQRWRPEKVLRQRARDNRLIGVVSGRSVVRITIDSKGQILETSLAEAGPADWLDDEAVRAARAAGPFINPPGVLFDKNGRFTFTFGFKVTVHVPSQLARLLKPNDNVVQAITNALSSETAENLWCFHSMEACGKDCPDEDLNLAAQMEPCHYK